MAMEAIAEIRRVLEGEFGWSFVGHRIQEVKEAAECVARAVGIPDVGALARSLAKSGRDRSRLLGLLVPRLTVNETCFFRDPPVFRHLEGSVLPALIRRRAATRRLRIWSAGCCTGEEAYSLAIALSRVVPSSRSWDIEVIGTDVNRDSIAHAERATYGNWAFRRPPPWLKQDCLTLATPGKWQVRPEVRNLVSFQAHNLLDGLPSGFEKGEIDLIFCRNVLMYFSSEQSERIVATIHAALAEDGVLCVAPYEMPRLIKSGLEPLDPLAGAFLGRSSRQQSPAVDLAKAERPGTIRSVKRTGLPRAPRRRRAPRNKGRSSPRRTAIIKTRAPEPDAFEANLRQLRKVAGEGRLWEALKACDELLSTDRLNAELHYLKATILQENGLVPEALIALRRTLYLEPEFIPAHMALATHARVTGRQAQAARSVSEIRKMLSSRQPEQPVAASEGLTAGALLAMMVGKEDGL